MPPKPFGHLSEREVHKRDQQAKYRAEQCRQNAAWELEVFCKAQRERIARTLKASTDRILAARWGAVAEGDGMFAVTRHGTCEVSKPLRREYKEQSGDHR
jgi:hypothetical protein